MRASQCRPFLPTALLKVLAVLLFVSLSSPVNAGPLFTFPNDFYVQAGGGSHIGNIQLQGPTDPQPLFAQVSGHALSRVTPGFGFADTLSTAAYGLLEAQASASTIFLNGFVVEMDGSADAAFLDSWSVTPAATGGLPIGTPVDVFLTVVFSASIGTPLGHSGGLFDSDAHLQVRLGTNIFCTICPPDLLLIDTLNVNQPFTEVQSLRIPTVVGGGFSALVQLIAGADSIADPVSGHGFTLVDAAQSGKVFLDAPPGVDLISGSGHDYSTPTAVTPEPGTLMLLAFSLTGLGSVLLRRTRT